MWRPLVVDGRSTREYGGENPSAIARLGRPTAFNDIRSDQSQACDDPLVSSLSIAERHRAILRALSSFLSHQVTTRRNVVLKWRSRFPPGMLDAGTARTSLDHRRGGTVRRSWRLRLRRKALA